MDPIRSPEREQVLDIFDCLFCSLCLAPLNPVSGEELDQMRFDGLVFPRLQEGASRRSLRPASTTTRRPRPILDHEDLSTTALYTKVTDERTAGAVMLLRSFGRATPPTTAEEGQQGFGVIGSGSVSRLTAPG
jgi:hypothetical protein